MWTDAAHGESDTGVSVWIHPQPVSKELGIHLDQAERIQAEVEISKEEERCGRVARIRYPTGRRDCQQLFEAM